MKNVLKTGMWLVLAATLCMLAGCPSPTSSGGSSKTYCTVTFDAQNGEAPVAQKIEYGKKLTLPATPVKAGFVFGGWNGKPDGTGTAYTADSFITKTLTLYAQWTPEGQAGRTVTFDSQGGSPVAAVQVPTAGASIGADMPANPTKTGFDFGGWFTQTGGNGNAFTASTPVNASITVYAKWTAQSGTVVYTVTFNASGGLFAGGTAQQEVETAAGSAITLPVPPTRQYYSFAGWFTGTDGGGTEFTASTPVNTHITVYASWLDTRLTVNFYNGGELYNTQTVTAGASAVLPAEPAIDYQFFKGWYTEQNGGGTALTASTPVNANTDVYAFWAAFTVSFDSEGGNPVNAVNIQKKGDTISALPTPTHPTAEAFDFSGWFTGDGGTGTQFTTSTPVNAPITLYAKWTPRAGVTTHVVTFNASSGAFSDSSTSKTITAVAGNTIANLPAAPGKQHYAFDGWYTAQNGGGTAFTTSTPVTAAITVYAKWLLNIKVKFYLIENDAGAIHEIAPASLGGTITVPDAPGADARAGYVFKKWVYKTGGTEFDFTGATPVNGDMTVYGKWAQLFTVQFDLNGADGSAPDSRIIEDGQALGELPAAPAREGYNFKGWHDNAAGTGSAYTAASVITEGKTLYAQWAQLFTVQFDLNGASGSAPANRIIEDGQALGELPAAPSREGYNFKGWHDNSEGTGSAYTAASVITADKTLYAQWAQLVTVTFNANSVAGITGSTAQVETGASLGAAFPAAPAGRTGYDFQWNTEANGSGAIFTSLTTVTETITVYARWVEGWVAATTGIANTTLYEHLVKAQPNTYATGAYGSRTNVAKVTTSSAQYGYSIVITPSFTGTLNLSLSAEAMRGSNGKLYWKYADGAAFSAEAGNFDTARNGGQWYTYELTSSKAVTAGTAITIQLGGFTGESADFYLANFVLLAERNSTGTSIVLEDFEGTPQISNIGGATSTIKTFNSSTILEVTMSGNNKGTAVKVTIPDGKSLSEYTKLNVEANLTGGSDSTYKDMYIWVSDTLPGSVSGAGNIKTASQISGSDKTKLFPYSFTLGAGWSNWSTAQNYTGDIYLVFGLAYSNGCNLGIDNISLEDSTPYTGFYPLYSGQQNLASGPISLLFTDAGTAAFDQSTFTISKAGSGSQIVTLASGWTSGTAAWRVDGKIITGTASVTISAAAYTTGSHTLTVIAYRDGAPSTPWSKTLHFTVTE